MILSRLRFRSVFFFALLALNLESAAQGFNVQVAVPVSLRGKMTLLIYDKDSTARVINSDGKNPMHFKGIVNGPVYAELRHTNVAQPLCFFIENSNINITFNKDNPNGSPITGSRSNSMLRYQLEQCAGEDWLQCLTDYVKGNPENVLTPYILDYFLTTSSDCETMQSLYQLLSGDAKGTYHYKQLGKRLKNLAAIAEGSTLPSFEYTSSKEKKTKIDSVLSDSSYNIVLISATWCKQGETIVKELKEKFPNINTRVLNIDNEPKGWDAPFMDLLAIDHIPYLILTGPDKKIITKDFRIWELERILKNKELKKKD